jgi:hypothetical protein
MQCLYICAARNLPALRGVRLASEKHGGGDDKGTKYHPHPPEDLSDELTNINLNYAKIRPHNKA